jgi:hypothetical protein
MALVHQYPVEDRYIFGKRIAASKPWRLGRNNGRLWDRTILYVGLCPTVP